MSEARRLSERRAFRVIDADRKSVRYRSTRDDDADLREKGFGSQRIPCSVLGRTNIDQLILCDLKV